MSNTLHEVTLLFIISAALISTASADAVMKIPRYSVFAGDSSVKCEAGSDSAFGAWYRDVSVKNVKEAESKGAECCCKNYTTMDPLPSNDSEKYAWEVYGNGGSRLDIRNITMNDDGVYCFSEMIMPNDTVNSTTAACYLKVSIDDNNMFIPMVTILACGGVWSVVMAASLGCQHYQEFTRNLKAAKTEQDSGSSIHTSDPLIRGVSRQTSYNAIGHTNPGFASQREQEKPANPNGPERARLGSIYTF